jgi:hypothetical protein
VPKIGDEATTPATAPARVVDHPGAVPISAAEPQSARQACGERRFIALAACMDRRCEEARFRTSPECVAILARKASREGYAPH